MSTKTILLFYVLSYVLFGTLLGCVGENSEPSPVGEEKTATDTNGAQQLIREESVSETASLKPIEAQTVPIQLDEAIGDLLTTLGDGATKDRIVASTALGEQAAKVVSQHADWLKAGSVSQRRGMMLMMTGKAQVFPDETFSLVKLALADDDSKVRSIGVQLIRQLLPTQAAELHMHLLEMMKDKQEMPAIRNSILRLIALVPGDVLQTETALSDLILAEGDDPTVKQAALQSYVKLAPAEPAIATLVSVLENSNSNEVKRTTAVLLGKYGTRSKGAVELLGGLIETDDEDLQEASAEALARIGSPSIDVLVAKLDSKKLLTRQMAIFTLGVIGPSARDHVRRLEGFITEGDPDTSLIAKEAIFSILKPRQ